MTSVGGFREGEIVGKPFLVFTFSGEAAIDSCGEDLPLQHLFLCPSIRFKVHELQRKERGYTRSRRDVFPMDVSPRFGADQQVQNLLDSDSHDDICKLPVLPLFWCNNEESYDSSEFRCGACRSSKLGIGYYFCVTCCEMFHKECVESPLEIKHPSHPFHHLQLSSSLKGTLACICCETNIDKMIYHCPTNNLSMHPVCAMKPIPFVIDHSKRHPHPLFFYPRQSSLVCNVCGWIKDLIPTYVCVRCNFAVHQDCVSSPTVIRILRHHHRISFTSSLPSGKWSCGVCRKEVDNNYGAYSCNKCDDYFVHTRCALRRDLWDGVELEEVPEEPEIVVEPFEVIAEGIILHFSHGHDLKLEVCGVYDNDKFCQACVLPIYEGNYYSCMDQCDFILHEVCANAPRMKHNRLHAHPLTLKVVTNQHNDNDGYLLCDACNRRSCGFVYVSEQGHFELDLRCASVSEPFEYQGHEDPLFLALTREEEESSVCHICQKRNDDIRKLNCIKCDYVICFRCATLPYKARYEDDKHLLTFFEGKEIGDRSGWCEICERKIVDSTKEGFYLCDDYCCTTLHINCLLGEDLYMKPDHTIIYCGMELHILRNNIQLRPFCCCCEQRCPHRVVFQKKNEVFCSLRCVVNSGG